MTRMCKKVSNYCDCCFFNLADWFLEVFELSGRGAEHVHCDGGKKSPSCMKKCVAPSPFVMHAASGGTNELNIGILGNLTKSTRAEGPTRSRTQTTR